jgi:hypothetical protein
MQRSGGRSTAIAQVRTSDQSISSQSSSYSVKSISVGTSVQQKLAVRPAPALSSMAPEASSAALAPAPAKKAVKAPKKAVKALMCHAMLTFTG